jgi:aldehyde oxidoreductase
MPKITFTVNGHPQQVQAEPNMVLIDFLRGDLHLTGAKQSCDRKRQCGACTVIVNKKAVRSCLTKLVTLEGAEVITVEGLGTPENPHLIQEAFVLTGAIQCGFCTPGMIMAAKALLDQNPEPDGAAIQKAFVRNLCRCTGYKKIIEAVQLAGRFIRGETSPAEIRGRRGKGMLGVSHERPTAMIKACGLALFNDDVPLPEGAVELSVVLSTEYHAVITSIDTSAVAAMPGVIGIMTAEDIKGSNRIRQIHPDQPVLCEDKVRTLGDPIIAIAAETRSQARAAAAAVKVEYDPLPVMMTPEEALAPGAYPIHPFAPNNIFHSQPIVRGDAEQALKESAAVIEAEFSTQINHQAPLEPEISSAYLEGEGENPQLIVIGRSINIHGHLAQLKEALGYENMRYKEAFSGGQFGIKASITTEAVTAAAALHFRRPVRYVPTMAESMLISNKRHGYPSMKVRLGADRDGHLTAYSIDFTINKGAYTLLGLNVLLRSLFMLNGSYYIPNVLANGRSIYTNNIFGSAARGAGPPQTDFALESVMDMLAEKMNLDPLEFRRINALKPGQAKATGMVAQEWSFDALCEDIKPHYERALREAETFNAQGGKLRRGVGLAGHSFGIGYAADFGKMTVELDPDDGITIYAAVADPGEGNDAMLTQMAAHQMGLPLDKIRLYTRDTDKTVGMGPAAGSRMTFMAGNTLLNALGKLQEAMKSAGTNSYAGLKAKGLPTCYEGFVTNPGKFGLDPKTGEGDTLVSECHNIQMAEAEVDTESGAVRVLKMTVAVDAGTILNPQAVEGQLEGGMDQGVGYALREEYVHGKTRDFITFKFPTIRDIFESEILIRETPRSNGPLGATGVGEMTMVSTAPAVINAIYRACGARVYGLPATPEKVKAALEAVKS